MNLIFTPSRRLHQLVKQRYQSVRDAALSWGVDPTSLERFLSGQGGINGSTIARIIEGSGEDYDTLFEHRGR